MKPNTGVRASVQLIDHRPVPPQQILDGDPRAGVEELGQFDGLEVGIWEMTPGVMRDVEADEVFVVLAGAATVEFDAGTAALELRPGDVARLADGTATVWTVTETLRKGFLTPPP